MTDADRDLQAARAAVGVTGDASGEIPGRWSPISAVLAFAASAGAFGPLAVLVTGRSALAEITGLEATAIDDRGISTVAMGILTALVAGLLLGRRRTSIPLFVVGTTAAAAAGVLLAIDGGLGLVAALGGLGIGLTWTSVRQLVANRLEPAGRLLALRAATAGVPAAFGAAGVLTGTGQATTASAVLAASSVVGLTLAIALRSRPPAADDQAVRKTVADDVADPVDLPLGQIARRLLARDTLGRVGVVSAVAGLLVLPIPLFIGFHLDDHFGVTASAAALGLGIIGVTATAVLALGVTSTVRAYAEDPGHPADRAGRLFLAAAGLFVGSALVDHRLAVVLLAASGLGLAWAAVARAELVLFATLPSTLRGVAASVTTVSLTLGALIGLAVLAGIDSRFGTRWALSFAALPFAAVVPGLRRISRTAGRELDRTLQAAVGSEQIKLRRRSGEAVPLLECKGIDFSYGQVQVLFDVDFTVDEGEMVALLGTNGAGKSTLLRVISGLGLPQAGTVRFDGRDITFAATGDRVRAGISQVPGGKAVFGPMSVVENLRVYGYALGSDKAAVDRGIERAFDIFPRLSERRNQTAQTLSGGEQQMLALSKALILEPKLLLIDELSLGLAPKIVSQLIEMVREINRSGTAVVLVEQSVNVALSLVEHAYYMEKGEMRFDGRAAELLERPDILRSVYLKGAAQGLGGDQ